MLAVLSLLSSQTCAEALIPQMLGLPGLPKAWALLFSIHLNMLLCWPAGVAFALNHFGPLCRAEGEEDQPLDLGDVQVC